jgi:hypothetical protein
MLNKPRAGLDVEFFYSTKRLMNSFSYVEFQESPVESVAVAGLRRNSADLGADVENSSTFAPMLSSWLLTPGYATGYATPGYAHCTLCNTSCPTVKKREHVLKCHVLKPVMFCPYPGCDWKSLFVNYTGYYHHRNCHRGFSEAARNESHKFNDQIDQFFSVCFGGKKRGSFSVLHLIAFRKTFLFRVRVE